MRPILNHMVNLNADELGSTFSAISDPTRRSILSMLKGNDLTISQIAEPFEMSLPAVLKHLKVLEKAGLLTRFKVGRTNYCSLNIRPIYKAFEWFNDYKQFWESQLDALSDYVEQLESSEKDS